MPLYFFDTDNGEDVFRDGDGMVLDSVSSTIWKARKLGFDLFYGSPTIGRTIIACVVRDDVGAVVYRFMLDICGELGPSARLK